ncbi:hypothetical protein BH23GEM7_BH23GEM7_29630 [soil metagenome]
MGQSVGEAAAAAVAASWSREPEIADGAPRAYVQRMNEMSTPGMLEQRGPSKGLPRDGGDLVDQGAIREFAGRLAREFTPERIILFGSYAAGTARPDSDVDLFVIMRFEGAPVRQAVEILRRLRPPFAVDLLVRTPEEVQRRLQQNDFFVQDVVRDGTVLYEADHR